LSALNSKPSLQQIKGRMGPRAGIEAAAKIGSLASSGNRILAIKFTTNHFIDPADWTIAVEKK